MTDQCKHCTVRGETKECLATPCHQHESWYATNQQGVIGMLRISLDHKTTLLNSCEKALADRDAQIERLSAKHEKLRAAVFGMLPPCDDGHGWNISGEALTMLREALSDD